MTNVETQAGAESTSYQARRPPILVSARTAKELIGVRNTKFWELVKIGAIKMSSVGRRRMVIYSSLEALADARTTERSSTNALMPAGTAARNGSGNSKCGPEQIAAAAPRQSPNVQGLEATVAPGGTRPHDARMASPDGDCSGRQKRSRSSPVKRPGRRNA
jgi:hypothetical protein